MTLMSQDITKLSEVGLRDRKGMAGGLSTLERQAALTDSSATVYERMALENSSARSAPAAPSLGEASQGLRMPSAQASQINPSLPGVMPNRESMLGVLAPEGPRPMLTSFQQVTMPPAQITQSNLSPLAPSKQETAPFEHAPSPTPTTSVPTTQNQSQPSTLENLASNLSQINPGNIWQDLKRGMNPILQLGKELFGIVTGTMIAFINFFFKPNKYK